MPPQSWANRSNTYAPQRAADAPEAPRQRVPFWDAAGRAFEDQGQNNNSGGREVMWREALRERHRRIEAALGEPFAQAWEMDETAFGQGMAQDTDPYGADAGVRRQARDALPRLDEYERRLTALRRARPELATIPDLGALRAQFDFDQRMVRLQAETGARDQPVASFLGGTTAGMLSIENLAATAATGGLGAGRPLLMRMGQQALANAGAEAVMVPGRAAAAAEYGGPAYGGKEALGDIIGAGVGGAVLEPLGDVARAGVRTVARRFSGSAEPEERGLAVAASRLIEDETVLAGADDFDAARDLFGRGDPPPVLEPDRDLDSLFDGARANQVSGPVSLSQPASGEGLIAADYRGRRIWSGRFDPRALDVDAARFQYKADGDAEGVTGRLRGVERWDATASGKALVFEDLDGRLIVADGHQRRGLARRLAEQGWEDAQLDAYLFRASEGWTAREVRVVAALKNIREGSGAVLDAAKLFREAPAALRDRSLPVTGDLVSQARQLASLNETAFRAVVNGLIPERYGAVLGELAGDRPELQADLVALLQKGEPGSAEGARALVQEAMLDDFIATEGVQQDLFGGLPREATVIARGKIREAVMAGLRKDARLFGQLVRNADAIEAGGNMLARSDNEAKLAIDRAAGELVSRLSLRAGDMGEAFQEAARAVTVRETTPGAAAKGLIQRIRQAVKTGEALEQVRAEALNPPAPRPAALDAVAAFDAPGGRAQAAQLTPKPEDVEIVRTAAEAGLFDDLPEEDGLSRAIDHLTACAPGRA